MCPPFPPLSRCRWIHHYPHDFKFLFARTSEQITHWGYSILFLVVRGNPYFKKSGSHLWSLQVWISASPGPYAPQAIVLPFSGVSPQDTSRFICEFLIFQNGLATLVGAATPSLRKFCCLYVKRSCWSRITTNITKDNSTFILEVEVEDAFILYFVIFVSIFCLSIYISQIRKKSLKQY